MNKKWNKYWATPYSITNCVMFGRQYTKFCKKELGIGFSEVHFIFKKGIATVFRDENENNKFSKKMAISFKKDHKLAIKIINKTLKIQSNLLEIFRKKEILTPSFFNKFVRLYDTFLPYFLATAWGANTLDIKKDKELLKILSDNRKLTEKFYADSEKFLHRYFDFIAKKEKIENKEILSTLTDSELKIYLKNKKLPSFNILRNRFNLSLVSSKKGKSAVCYGNKANKKINQLKLENYSVNENISILKGNVAFGGKVSGGVKIVIDPKEVSAFKKGEIFVTTMTRPEWISAIKKAKAIITDVGGILCHAAIVSRELKTPCIIGTKIATQVLKDGYLVEVDANKGLVRILKT